MIFSSSRKESKIESTGFARFLNVFNNLSYDFFRNFACFAPWRENLILESSPHGTKNL